MAGYTSNILKRYGKDLEDLYGGIEDWKVVKNYNELMGIFEKKRADKDSYNKFKQINQNLTRAGSLLTDNDFLTEKEEFDSNNPDLLNTDAYKRYETFKTMNSKPDANFSDFMKEDGLSRKELMDKGYLKINKVPLDEESQKSLLFTKAGLSPEDQQFYEEYKKAGGFDKAGQYNEDLMNLVYDNIPGLTSQRGKMGDVYLKSALMKAQQMGIPTEKAKDYDLREVNGELLRINKETGTVDKLYGEPKSKENFISGIKPYPVPEPINGEYFIEYMKEVNGEPQIRRAKVTKEEWERYKANQSDDAMPYEQRLNISNQYKLQYKLDLQDLGLTGKKGGSKGTSNTAKLDIETGDLLSDIKTFYKAGHEWDLMDRDQQEAYKRREQNLARRMGVNVEQFQAFKEQIAKMTDKEAKNFMAKTFNMKSIDEAGKQAKILQQQKVQIESLIENVMSKVRNGELKGNELQEVIIKIYNQLQGKVDSQFLQQIQTWAKSNNIRLN